jgi:hypothetical protein
MHIFDASDLLYGPNPADLSGYGWRLLAEGDSWFTVSTPNVVIADNLLRNLEFTQTTAVVNCAYPGDTLRKIIELDKDKRFSFLVNHPTRGRRWSGLLISAGGNDLIDAVQVPPKDAGGTATPLAMRLLKTPAEVAAAADKASDPRSYVSDAGWATFAHYFAKNFKKLVALRDKTNLNRGRPLMLHTYAVPTARPAGVVTSPNGWLYPALVAYGVPGFVQQGVTQLLFERFRALLMSFDGQSGDANATQQVHVYDSAKKVTLVNAAPGTTGPSGDWINEIHLTTDGYFKLGKLMGPWVESVLAKYPAH